MGKGKSTLRGQGIPRINQTNIPKSVTHAGRVTVPRSPVGKTMQRKLGKR